LLLANHFALPFVIQEMHNSETKLNASGQAEILCYYRQLN